MVAGVAGNLGADAALHAFLAQMGAPGPTATIRWMVLPGETPSLRSPIQVSGREIAGFEAVGLDRLDLSLVDLLLAEWDLHAQDLGAAVEQALACSSRRKMAVPCAVS